MRVFSILSALALVATLVACSKKDNPQDPPPVQSPVPPPIQQPVGGPNGGGDPTNGWAGNNVAGAGQIIRHDSFQEFLQSTNVSSETQHGIRGLVRRDAIISKTFVFVGHSQCRTWFTAYQSPEAIQEINRCQFANISLITSTQQSLQQVYQGISGQNYQGQTNPNQPFVGQPGIPQQPIPQNANDESRVAYKFIFDQNGKLRIAIKDGSMEFRSKEDVSYKFASDEEVDTTSSDEERTNVRPIIIDNFTAEAVGGMPLRMRFEDKNGGVIFLAKVKLSDDGLRAESMIMPGMNMFIKGNGHLRIKKVVAGQGSLDREHAVNTP